MSSSVLMGARSSSLRGGRLLWLLQAWLPVVVCLIVLSRESTDSFSAEYTSGPLRHAFELVFGTVSPERWDVVHHVMRKTGHFLGYGVTGLAWLRAWLLTWLGPLRRSGVWVWRRVGLLLGVLCTMGTACIDELHQTYIPSRTGLISDAWLDTAGAAAMMALLVVVWALLRDVRPAQRGNERQ